MDKVKSIIRGIPGAVPTFRAVREILFRMRWRNQPPSAIFTHIYEGNRWRGAESRSGTGSDISKTRVIIQELPTLCASLNIASILDIPCGDFHWMSRVSLDRVSYTGADIVEKLIDDNDARHKMPNVQFRRLDILTDTLPRVDLIFCRDCLPHFAYADIARALSNFCRTGSGYLLTTTYTEQEKNRNIPTGHWRPLNLQIAPFCLPPPLKLINEQTTEPDGHFGDKSMALWHLDQVREALLFQGMLSLAAGHA